MFHSIYDCYTHNTGLLRVDLQYFGCSEDIILFHNEPLVLQTDLGETAVRLAKYTEKQKSFSCSKFLKTSLNSPPRILGGQCHKY